MITFEQFWQKLYDHGGLDKYHEECRQIWFELTPEQREQMANTIFAKLNAHKFVHYDSRRAMRENLRLLKPTEPDFLSGAEQDRLHAQGIPLVQVKYGDGYKICTRQTALDFHLPITINPW